MEAESLPEAGPESRFNELLVGLGLPNAAAKAYVSLLSLGRSGVQAISDRSGLERAQTYHVLKDLQSRGIVEVTLTRPLNFVPLDAEAAISRLLQQQSEQLSEIRSSWNKLRGELRVQKKQVLEERPSYSLVKGRRNIYLRMVLDISHSHKEVRLLMSPRGVMRERRFTKVYGGLSRKSRTGTKVRIITQVTPENVQAVADWARIAEIRSATPQTSNSSTYDDSRTSICLSVVEDLSLDTESHVSLWTNAPTFITAMNEYFWTLWKSSTPVEELDEFRQAAQLRTRVRNPLPA